MLLHGRHGRQRPVNHLAGDVVFNEPVRLAPGQYGPDAVSLLARNLRDFGPDGSQDAQHVFPPDPVHSQPTEHRQDMLGHTLFPVLRRFLTAPALPVRLERLLGRLPERRDLGLAFLSERIAAGPRQFPVLEGFVPRLGQADHGEPAQANVAAPAVYGETLDPGL